MQDIQHLINIYASATTRSLAQRLAREVAALREPRLCVTGERAFDVTASLAEALAGFTFGVAESALIQGISTWLDENAAARARQLAKRHTLSPTEPASGYLRDRAARPLVDALAARLHARFGWLEGELAGIACEIAWALADRPVLAYVFQRLAADDLVAERFATELRAGWAAYSAIVGSGRADRDRGSPLWSEWTRRVKRDRDNVNPREYIVVIH